MKKKIITLSLVLIVWVVIYFNLTYITKFLIDIVFGMEKGQKLTEALRFFIFEVPKVLLLLALIVFVVGIIRSFFSPEKTKRYLEGKSLFLGNVLAATLGIFTPFCSCSAIPLFLGFIEAGIPLGVTFSFLIAAPMINEVAIGLLLVMFGWKIMLIYIGTGLAIAIVSGYILEKLNLQKYVAEWVYQIKTGNSVFEEEKITIADRINVGFSTSKQIIKKVWIYIIIGIGVGSWLHGYVPQEALAGLLGSQNWYSVPLAIVIGIPLYSNAAGIIPIISVLIEKGVTIGTALAFMMSVIALSLPEIIILKKVLKWQLIAIFVGVVGFGITIVGYLFNFIF